MIHNLESNYDCANAGAVLHAKYDPYTNEELVSTEDEAIQQTEAAAEEDPEYWFYKHFQYMPVNWWI